MAESAVWGERQAGPAEEASGCVSGGRSLPKVLAEHGGCGLLCPPSDALGLKRGCQHQRDDTHPPALVLTADSGRPARPRCPGTAHHGVCFSGARGQLSRRGGCWKAPLRAARRELHRFHHP